MVNDLKLTSNLEEYINSQMKNIEKNYRNYKLFFIAIFSMIFAINTSVAGLSAYVMVIAIENSRFDTTGIIAIAVSIISLLSLFLLAFTSIAKYRFKHRIYLDAYRSVKVTYINYLHKTKRYKSGSLTLLKHDVEQIVRYSQNAKHEGFLKITINAIKGVEDA